MKNGNYSLEMYLSLFHGVVLKNGFSQDLYISVNLKFAELLSGNFIHETYSKVARAIITDVRKKSYYPEPIKKVFESDFFEMRNSQFIAEAYKIWLAFSNSQQTITGNWFGSVGDKIEISVEILISKPFEKEFDGIKSISYFIKARDENGNIFIWFSKIELSGKFKISAKIKKHSSFENEKQNEIFYVKVLEKI